MTEHDVQVANLPTLAFGSRSPIWWGVVLMIVIESTIFALLFSSYFYLRLGFAQWPTPDAPPPQLLVPTLNLLLLILSVVPLQYSSKAIERGDRRKALYGLVINLIMGLVVIALRFIEFDFLGFKWNSSMYGSLVWIILGFHTLHLVADVVQGWIVFALFAARRAGEKQQLGLQVEGIYWNFVVLSGIPVYLLLYVYPFIGSRS